MRHTSVDSEGMPAESNRCPATGREWDAICVPRTAVQTLHFKGEEREQDKKSPRGLLLIACVACVHARVFIVNSAQCTESTGLWMLQIISVYTRLIETVNHHILFSNAFKFNEINWVSVKRTWARDWGLMQCLWAYSATLWYQMALHPLNSTAHFALYCTSHDVPLWLIKCILLV